MNSIENKVKKTDEEDYEDIDLDEDDIPVVETVDVHQIFVQK